ncbi:hypothetical protein [Xylophilus sp. ASV27]|uniref:hypothetical protein n=1 Tax=Xylophilus sp. ASV27 TaxID=2795129 RepID=UPI0018ED9491|nr:hypothetical protein [Xylophilus sp. ASV27]
MSGAAAQAERSGRAFLVALAALCLAYGGWLLAFWPGVLGPDSYAILLELQTQGGFQSGKPSFWYYFVHLFYGSTRRVEAPIAFQLLFAALVFARMLSWCWRQGFWKITLFCAVFICFAPHIMFFTGTLYPDALFSIAAAGLLFELWLAARAGRLAPFQLGMVFITLPFALFCRQNGFVFLASLALASLALRWPDRLRLWGMAVFWSALVLLGGRLHATESHSVLFPLAAFETVNFLQPRPMNLPRAEPRVSEATIEALTRRHDLQNIIRHYDRDYWDPLVYQPDGPELMRIPPEDKAVIVREFFRYNLWRNLPAFLGSRVNIFMTSLLAQGGILPFDYTQQVLAQVQTKSQMRRFHLDRLEAVLLKLHKASLACRWLLWTPALGILLLLWGLPGALRQRRVAELLVLLPLLAQLGGIFVFSIAGEYRYLLPFAVAPVLLLPMLQSRRGAAPSS